MDSTEITFFKWLSFCKCKPDEARYVARFYRDKLYKFPIDVATANSDLNSFYEKAKDYFHLDNSVPIEDLLLIRIEDEDAYDLKPELIKALRFCLFERVDHRRNSPDNNIDNLVQEVTTILEDDNQSEFLLGKCKDELWRECVDKSGFDERDKEVFLLGDDSNGGEDKRYICYYPRGVR